MFIHGFESLRTFAIFAIGYLAFRIFRSWREGRASQAAPPGRYVSITGSEPFGGNIIFLVCGAVFSSAGVAITWGEPDTLVPLVIVLLFSVLISLPAFATLKVWYFDRVGQVLVERQGSSIQWLFGSAKFSSSGLSPKEFRLEIASDDAGEDYELVLILANGEKKSLSSWGIGQYSLESHAKSALERALHVINGKA